VGAASLIVTVGDGVNEHAGYPATFLIRKRSDEAPGA
jgi:hypothetical protein